MLNLALITITGLIGPEMCVGLLKDIASAVDDPMCGAVALLVNSPGAEMCAELVDVADAIYACPKPVYGIAHGAAESGGYWLLSQARGGISASRGTVVGSIGVITIIEDTSAAETAAGKKTIVLRSQPDKTAWTPGEAFTDAAAASITKKMSQFDALFRECVARARPAVDLSKQTGDSYIASEALTLGLIDRVESYAEFMARLTEPTHV